MTRDHPVADQPPQQPMSHIRRFPPAGKLLVITLLVASATGASAQAPGWARLLHWISGDSDRTTVPIDMMGAHMQSSRRAPAQAGDRARGAM
ncbi:MAG: hypothetical protein H0X27_04135, partial [Caulobacteraceae bacterium]|nr:hypothetical protein [Caulobacteraceae bacterium]